jgi:serine/threonine protein kinase
VPHSGPVHGGTSIDKAPHYTPVPGQKKYKRVGDYDIVSKLGQGAMGSVYLARQCSSGKMVALKILPPDLAKDEELLERFRREARASQRISHPNIVSAVDFGTVEKYHYIAMDFVDGPDLETHLKKTGPFSEEVLLRVCSDMCNALEIIEKDGIVHRDIKPSNIMMSSQGVFRLTDLGLASAGQGDQRLTMTGFAVGTPYYLSPEQARGQADVDIRADYYSLGATLYHLATGSVPFPGTNPVVVMTQHISAPLKPPHEVHPAVSRPVSALIMRLMEKEREIRPQNSRQLRETIERCKQSPAPAIKSTPDTSHISPRAANVPVRYEKEKAKRDTVQAMLDALLGFLPGNARIPAAITGLLIACGALITLIVILLRANHR